MAAGLFDSAVYRELILDAEIAARFSDAAEIGAWLRVEAALAKTQGALGLIPANSAVEISRACEKIEIEPAALASGTGRDGIPVPAFVAELRGALDASHAACVHFGATTQDIMDTGLVLRLREVCDIVDARLRLALQALADLAEAHAGLPMVARTRHMPATPTGFGAVVAAWGAPLLAQHAVLAQLRPRLLRVSLAGASGNSTALGAQVGELRAAFARELGLEAGDLCWHTDRSALAEFSALSSRICAAFAKIAADCLFAATPEVGELKLPAGGGSSTMPHKQNPVLAETLVALHEIALGADAAMSRAQLHRQQRDASAWMLEWHALPQVCLSCGRALQLGIALLTGLEADASRMLANLEGAHGLVYAEAISFRLARDMPRPEAQSRVREMCADAAANDRRLPELAAERYSDIDWQEIADPATQLGDAPAQAQLFAARVRAL